MRASCALLGSTAMPPALRRQRQPARLDRGGKRPAANDRYTEPDKFRDRSVLKLIHKFEEDS